MGGAVGVQTFEHGGSLSTTKARGHPSGSRHCGRGRECFQPLALLRAIVALQVGDVVAHDRRRIALAGKLHVEHQLAAGA